MGANGRQRIGGGGVAQRLYNIGDVAKLTGVPVKTIRYYSEIGLLPPAETSAARYRRYTTREIWRLELIRTLRYAEFSLEEIRAILAGEVPVETAIDWQLEALDGQIRHLARIRAVLRQARANVHDEPARYLHDIGAALALNAEERRRFLTEKMQAALGGDAAPPEWREPFLRELERLLPDELSPEQAAAWTELTALLNDPTYVAATRQRTASFWASMRERGVDAAWWNEGMLRVSELAAAAVARGAGPGDEATQVAVRAYVELNAAAMGRPADDDFWRWFGGVAPTFMDRRSERIQELLEVLRAGRAEQPGAPGGPEQASPYSVAGQRLLLAGLAWRVAQLDAADPAPRSGVPAPEAARA